MYSYSHEVSFTLFGFQIIIQPFFWILAVFLSALNIGRIDFIPVWIIQLLIGIVSILIAVLVHELGHALAFRYVFHTHCSIIVHGFGGATIPLGYRSKISGFVGTLAECFLSFSGPLAGFLLAGVCLLLYQVIHNAQGLVPSFIMFFLWWTAAISIVWGIFNLLPIYPMDGGHIARNLSEYFLPRNGIKYSLMLSLFLSSLLAVVALRLNMFFVTFLFAYFAYQNYQEMSHRIFRF